MSRFLFFVVILSVPMIGLSQPAWPTLNYSLDEKWPQLPVGWTFEEAPGVAVDKREHVFVFHRGASPIIEFDAAGRFARSWGTGVFGRPHSLKFDREGNLWAVDDHGHVVVKLDNQGRVRLVLGRKNTPGETDELFSRPTDVAFGPGGDVYVTDGYGNSRVVQFNQRGEFVRAWGKKGSAPGEFNLPHTVAVDSRGLVYVGDRENRRMQVFTRDGQWLAQWTHAGSPWGVTITDNDEVFLCDGYANRVVKLNLNGEIQGAFGQGGRLPGQLNFAHQLAVAPSGNIYVAEIKNWRVQKFVSP